MDFRHQTPVHTFLELFKVRCVGLLPAQLEGGSRGPSAYKPPPFHNSFSFHAGLRGDRIGEAQSVLMSLLVKDIKFNWIQEAIRSSIICQ
ncbi:hypothetical protein AMECASPLE_027536, partial [Ameca splendens]